MIKNIVFMGTPEFSVPVLKTLYQNKYLIHTVYTQPPQHSKRGQKLNKSAVQKISENFNLNVRYPISLENNDKEYEYFKSILPDLVIVVAYGQIIPKKFLKLSKFGFINIHASLLPKWRGAAPIQRSIMNGDKKTGISIMKIKEELDAGPVMIQKEVELNSQSNALNLSNQLSELGSNLILEIIKKIEKNETKFIEQDHSKATYAHKIKKSESKINWNFQASKIILQINALNPSPGAWFEYEGERFKIINAKVSSRQGKPGEIIDNKDIIIGCAKDSVEVIEIQRQGKKTQNTKDFILGFKFKPGIVLKF